MKKIKLVKIEMSPDVAWPLKLIGVVSCLYFIYVIYTNISNGYIIKHSVTYTIDEHPWIYSMNIAKKVLFSLLGFYYATFGIKLKKKKEV